MQICPGRRCLMTGYTIVMEECGFHGGYHARLHRHVSNVHNDELPVVAEVHVGAMFGEHEFYDAVIEITSAALAELARVD